MMMMIRASSIPRRATEFAVFDGICCLQKTRNCPVVCYIYLFIYYEIVHKVQQETNKQKSFLELLFNFNIYKTTKMVVVSLLLC